MQLNQQEKSRFDEYKLLMGKEVEQMIQELQEQHARELENVLSKIGGDETRGRGSKRSL